VDPLLSERADAADGLSGPAFNKQTAVVRCSSGIHARAIAVRAVHRRILSRGRTARHPSASVRR